MIPGMGHRSTAHLEVDDAFLSFSGREKEEGYPARMSRNHDASLPQRELNLSWTLSRSRPGDKKNLFELIGNCVLTTIVYQL
jgi:hypothetical protein